jgi:hypothetical protein
LNYTRHYGEDERQDEGGEGRPKKGGIRAWELARHWREADVKRQKKNWDGNRLNRLDG